MLNSLKAVVRPPERSSVRPAIRPAKPNSGPKGPSDAAEGYSPPQVTLLVKHDYFQNQDYACYVCALG